MMKNCFLRKARAFGAGQAYEEKEYFVYFDALYVPHRGERTAEPQKEFLGIC